MGSGIGANTLEAHQAAHFMQERGFGDAMAERLFEAVFVKGEDVGNRATLLRLAEEAGLQTSKIAELAHALESGAHEYDVRMDEREAQAIGVRGVPFFVFEGREDAEGGSRAKFAISGAQPVEVFKQALTKAWEEGGYTLNPSNEEKSSQVEVLTTGDLCGVDGADC
jgi:predicted DsbA family dithiol-disulfide isomerase